MGAAEKSALFVEATSSSHCARSAARMGKRRGRRFYENPIMAIGAGMVLVGASSCTSADSVAYKHWKVSPPVFRPLEEGAFENVAVKDPSIVYFEGNYHLFYTGKRVDQTDKGAKYSITTGYVAAPTLEGLNSAKRYNLSKIVDGNIIAPQIFYFAPQKLWYIMAHRYDRGNKPNLQPIYLTNPDINNVHGWSSPQEAGRWVEYCNG